jgi:hypothetical protein
MQLAQLQYSRKKSFTSKKRAGGFHCQLQATYLRIPVNAVCTPTTWLYLVRVQAPELKLLLKQWPAHVCRVVQLPRTETYHYTYCRPTVL